jgi:hypothetical protein
MIKFENFEVVGWEHAIRGMRNAMNSWAKMDSFDCRSQLDHCRDCIFQDEKLDQECPGVRYFNGNSSMCGYIGPNDRELMMKLRNAGTDHRKFMRQIIVYVDITAPLYWWKEFDTYKVGTVANSCSTMHTIHEKEFDISDFSCEHLTENTGNLLYIIIDDLNYNRRLFNETKDKQYWYNMIQMLPTSYNQRRTISMSYENLSNMYKSRKNHKLTEWRDLCKWVETELPYPELITGGDKE